MKRKTLIVTVAGRGARFNADLETSTLKCLYNTGDITKSTLYMLLEKADDFSNIIIVGGFMFDKLVDVINESFSKFKDRITLVYNDKYEIFNSGFSLICGINAVSNADELVFVEGDLIFDNESFQKVVVSNKNLLTANTEPIVADKSVIFYTTVGDRIYYEYDGNHKSLHIAYAFKSLYNSGQIWKFIDIPLLKKCVKDLSQHQKETGNGLDLIQEYMNKCETNDISVIQILKWYNCNTIYDYSDAIQNI